MFTIYPCFILRFRLCEAVVGDGAKRLLVIDVLNPRADRGRGARLDPPPVVGLAVGGRLPHVLKAPEVGPIGRALQPPHEAHEDVHALERVCCVCVLRGEGGRRWHRGEVIIHLREKENEKERGTVHVSVRSGHGNSWCVHKDGRNEV